MGNAGCSGKKHSVKEQPSKVANPYHFLNAVKRVRYDEIPLYLHNSQFYRNLDASDPDSLIEIPLSSWKDDDTIVHVDDFAQLLRVVRFWDLVEIPASVLHFCDTHPRKEWESSCTFDLDLGASKDLKDYFEFKGSIVPALKTGRPELLRHWLENNDCNSKHAAKALQSAAECGNLDLLAKLHVWGYPWSEAACALAAEHGHLPCLQYLHENGCPWDSTVCSIAAKRGHLACLQYAHQNGCKLEEKATLTRYVQCLRYALQHGCSIHSEALHWAVDFGVIDCLQLLCAHIPDLELRESYTETAAAAGNIVVLKFLVSLGCPCRSWIVVAAARASRKNPVGALLCLEYLIEDQGFAMSNRAFSEVLMNRSLGCLMYLVDIGCTCDFDMYLSRAEFESYFKKNDPRRSNDAVLLKCLKYVVDHGFSVNDQLIKVIVQNDLPRCQGYIRSIVGISTYHLIKEQSDAARNASAPD